VIVAYQASLLASFFIVKNCEFTIYSYGAISKCGEGEDDERE